MFCNKCFYCHIKPRQFGWNPFIRAERKLFYNTYPTEGHYPGTVFVDLKLSGKGHSKTQELFPTYQSFLLTVQWLCWSYSHINYSGSVTLEQPKSSLSSSSGKNSHIGWLWKKLIFTQSRLMAKPVGWLIVGLYMHVGRCKAVGIFSINILHS